MKTTEKRKAFSEKMDAIVTLTAEIEAEDAKNDTPENREKLTALLAEAETIRKSIEQDNQILGLKGFLEDPAHTPAGDDGGFAERFKGSLSIGDQFIQSEAYKKTIHNGQTVSGQGAVNAKFEAKGFLFTPNGQKATFDSTSTGLDSSRNYSAGPILIEQQPLTVRNLLSVGQTTQGIIYFIKEDAFTNAADMTAEEGEKPEATLDTGPSNVPVKKIAVVLKVTNEMWADFPMLRDYVNTRLRFMVSAKEEQQLVNGTGAGNQITGLLQTSGIQTQAKGGDTVQDAIYKAITKVRSVGFYQPDAIVINPTDYQGLRLVREGSGSGQYLGGGFMTGAFGTQFIQEPPIWGLRPVITSAIAAGTALVGSFRLGAQIWQREGIMVDSTNSNEDDFNFNRISLRVEERLALAVYRPTAFCSVTGL